MIIKRRRKTKRLSTMRRVYQILVVKVKESMEVTGRKMVKKVRKKN